MFPRIMNEFCVEVLIHEIWVIFFEPSLNIAKPANNRHKGYPAWLDICPNPDDGIKETSAADPIVECDCSGCQAETERHAWLFKTFPRLSGLAGIREPKGHISI